MLLMAEIGGFSTGCKRPSTEISSVIASLIAKLSSANKIKAISNIEEKERHLYCYTSIVAHVAGRSLARMQRIAALCVTRTYT